MLLPKTSGIPVMVQLLCRVVGKRSFNDGAELFWMACSMSFSSAREGWVGSGG